jgi:hypothetical protein
MGFRMLPQAIAYIVAIATYIQDENPTAAASLPMPEEAFSSTPTMEEA